jgi:hypothetical protein
MGLAEKSLTVQRMVQPWVPLKVPPLVLLTVQRVMQEKAYRCHCGNSR